MGAIGRDSIHPPLFYFLLKLWIAIGSDSLFWTRLLPTLFSTLAIIPMVLLDRELHLRPVVINSTVGLAAIHPYLLYYSQHVRMYTLLMLCALTSLWFFHAAIAPGSAPVPRIAVLTAGNIVAVNAHYYGWLVIGLECGYLIFWKREDVKRMAFPPRWCVAFTPWIYWAGKYICAKGGLASNLDWIQKPDAGALAWFFVDLAGFGDFPSIGRQAVTGLASSCWSPAMRHGGTREIARRTLRLPGAIPAVFRARVGGCGISPRRGCCPIRYGVIGI